VLGSLVIEITSVASTSSAGKSRILPGIVGKVKLKGAFFTRPCWGSLSAVPPNPVAKFGEGKDWESEEEKGEGSRGSEGRRGRVWCNLGTDAF